jgi:hypothetical protein
MAKPKPKNKKQPSSPKISNGPSEEMKKAFREGIYVRALEEGRISPGTPYSLELVRELVDELRHNNQRFNQENQGSDNPASLIPEVLDNDEPEAENQENQVNQVNQGSDNSARLDELEDIIIDNFLAFWKVGNALKEIRDTKLYLEKNNTFEDYCKRIWDIGKTHTYRLIHSAEVIENIKPVVEKKAEKDKKFPTGHFLPANEAQARKLTGLSPGMQKKAWKEVLAETKETGEPITARMIGRIVKTYDDERKEEDEKEREIQYAPKNADDEVSDEFKEAWDAMYKAIKNSIKWHFKGTNRAKELKYLEALMKMYKKNY